MGGRVAEEIIFGADKVTTGASSDIQQATDIARRMVTEWGMSEKLGRCCTASNEQEVFLGHSVTQHKNMSDATAAESTAEIRRIVDTAYATARKVLTENLDQLHTLAQGSAGIRDPDGRGDQCPATRRGHHPHRQAGHASAP